MKIIWLSDAIVSHSGFGGQSYNILRGLKRLGHDIVSISDAINWSSYKPFYFNIETQKVIQDDQYKSLKDGASIKIYPVSGFGSYSTIKEIYTAEKPDAFVCFQELRNLGSILSLESMIRKRCPLILWHIWDNSPHPYFNEVKYPCFDHVVCATKFVKDLLKDSKIDNLHYIPLGVDLSIFKRLSDDKRKELRNKYENLVNMKFDFVLGYIGRNQKRKRIYDMMSAFGKWARGNSNKIFFLHTDPTERGAPPLLRARKMLTPDGCTIIFTMPAGERPEVINEFYNMFDVNMNISWSEGFGLPILESMAAGTPTIASENAGSSQLVNSGNGWLLKNDFKYFSYGGDNCELITRNFVSEEKVIEALEDAYINKSVLLKEKSIRCMEDSKGYDINNVVNHWDKLLRSVRENHQPPQRKIFSIL